MAIFSLGLNPIVKLGANQWHLANSYAAHMDVITTRLNNLRALVARAEQRGQSKKEAALGLDMSPSFLSQLLGGKKMGDDVARKIEAAATLPHGWMDTPHSDDASNAGHESHDRRQEGSRLAAATKLVRMACQNLDVEFDQEDPDDAVIVLIASDYLKSRQEASVTVENLVDFTKRLREIRGKSDSERVSETAGNAGGGVGRQGPTRKAS